MQQLYNCGTRFRTRKVVHDILRIPFLLRSFLLVLPEERFGFRPLDSQATLRKGECCLAAGGKLRHGLAILCSGSSTVGTRCLSQIATSAKPHTHATAVSLHPTRGTNVVRLLGKGQESRQRQRQGVVGARTRSRKRVWEEGWRQASVAAEPAHPYRDSGKRPGGLLVPYHGTVVVELPR